MLSMTACHIDNRLSGDVSIAEIDAWARSSLSTSSTWVRCLCRRSSARLNVTASTRYSSLIPSILGFDEELCRILNVLLQTRVPHDDLRSLR